MKDEIVIASAAKQSDEGGRMKRVAAEVGCADFVRTGVMVNIIPAETGIQITY